MKIKSSASLIYSSRRFKIHVHTFVTGPFQENTFLAVDEKTNTGLFVDPGDEADRLADEVNRLGVTPLAIINTHAHLDHIGAVARLKEIYSIPFYLNEKEAPVLQSSEASYAMFGLPSQPAPVVDNWINTQAYITIEPFTIDIIPTPGHTPGGISLSIGSHVFGGDTIFRGSVGRTDLPGGNWNQLEESLVFLMKSITDDAIIHCGHGPDTDRQSELNSNPFIGPLRNRIEGDDQI